MVRLPDRAIRVVVAMLLVPVGALLGLLGLLLVWSPGTACPITDERGEPVPGSLSEKLRIRINGANQGVFLRSRDVRNPVLLVLHGGPGMPAYWLTHRYPSHLEDHFTVAWWEQRGAGLSYSPGIPPETMTLDQFVADTQAVADYLRVRFGVERVYLLAHSWGTYVGLQAVAMDPSRFHAYVGVSQITYQVRSEQASWAFMLERFRTAGNRRMVRALERAPIVSLTDPLPPAYDAVRDKAMHQLGVGTTHDMRSVVREIFLPSWRVPEYTLLEKVNLWRGKVASRKSGLWDRMQATDVTALVPELAIPAYFLHGVYDWTVSYTQARAYAAVLRAPIVGFYSFEHSAHSPIYEEPERLVRILLEDVVPGRIALADAGTGRVAGEA